ncbi:MAG TPA: hypothetical protein VFQ67_03120 [Allosphingosinicella sp.]|jgi:hypothetical protein|nr:hypothetical protein [Allosphingosinicella sp.]
MKLLAIAAALLALQPQPGSSQAPPAPSDALVERFIAALPDRDEIAKAAGEIDQAELSRLAGLNPGKESRVRAVLQSNLACSGPATVAGSLRMLRTIARNLGSATVQKLTSFYEGPDYAAFAALAARMEGEAKPSAADSAALEKMMAAYPLEAFREQLSRAEEIFAADEAFMEAAVKCATEQLEALEAAGLKAN